MRSSPSLEMGRQILENMVEGIPQIQTVLNLCMHATLIY
jgi:hypothetical protein